jgi:hypothetical protein
VDNVVKPPAKPAPMTIVGVASRLWWADSPTISPRMKLPVTLMSKVP